MKLIIREPSREAREVAMDPGTCSLGRSQENDITLNDNQVSRKHAQIIFNPDKGTFVIEDLRSTNGVHVNEVKIKE